MAEITFKGKPIRTVGELPAVGSTAPDFTLCSQSLEEISLSEVEGKKVLNIFPSIDTGVCATSVHTFYEKAHDLEGVTVLNISADLPFAAKRFCGTAGLSSVITLSSFRAGFSQDYGVEITDGPLRMLLSRAVVVLDENNEVLYTEQVPEIGQEPDYDAALAALR